MVIKGLWTINIIQLNGWGNINRRRKECGLLLYSTLEIK